MRPIEATVAECVWVLDVNGRRWASGTAAPERLDALAAGRLVADGLVPTGSSPEIRLGHTPAGTVLVQARVTDDLVQGALREVEHRTARGCGLRHFVDCEPNALLRRRSLAVPSTSEAAAVFRALMRIGDGARGGVHTVGLWDGSQFFVAIEDVGRHAAVDKAIGAVLLDRHDPGRLGLVLTARISAEIALKAARAGLAWIISRSIPTSLALEIAGAARMTLIARATSTHARAFSVPATDHAGGTA